MVSSFAAGFIGGLGEIAREEKRARDLREAEMEKLVKQQQNQLIPYLMQRNQQRTALAGEQTRKREWFLSRLGDDVDETTREAYSNLAASDPKVADSLISSIQKFEEETNRKLSGKDLITFTNVIEQTKPDDTSMEEWTRYAATQLRPSASGIDFDSTLERLLGADQEELYQLQSELMTPVSPAISFEPDTDRSAFLGMNPTEREQYRKQLEEATKYAFDVRFEELTRINEADDGTLPTEADQEEYNRLERMRDNPGMIIREFAPLVGPDLSEADPGFKRFYETFTTQTNPRLPQEQVMQEARDAIRRGANPEKVRQKMVDQGYDPSGL